ncbi:hypothetical protein MLD38_004356 [Melastoma candidum]|uniref:Uncharacterized protein n=1 Tax=Melastoma candidum TaxID=119954 RepID=A0ACB9S5S5_9MYRT|nr:hypothetical protein MLD38_004356 [Melastoma candidum]
MEEAGPVSEFPGFRNFVHEDVRACRRPSISRLRQRAPVLLQLKPTALSSTEMSSSSLSTSASSSLYYQSKDPIPLLSPLVIMPSLVSNGYVHQENAAHPLTD